MTTTLLAALLLAPEGEGAEHAATFLGVPNTVWQAVNLVIFLFLLVYFGRKPLVTFFKGRREGIEAALRKAEDDRRQAEEIARQMTERLAQIETELESLRVKAKKDTEVEQAALTRQTEEDAIRIAARATTEMDSRVRAARKELTVFASDLAVELATQMVKDKVGNDDHRRLITEGLQSLGKLAAVAPPAGKA